MSDAFDMPEGQSAIQRDLKEHEKQAYVNLSRVKAECRILHLGQGRLWYKHGLEDEHIESSPAKKDLGDWWMKSWT